MCAAAAATYGTTTDRRIGPTNLVGAYFSPTTLAFGVLTVRIENPMVRAVVSDSPPPEPGSPDDPNLVPPVRQSQNNGSEMALKCFKITQKMFQSDFFLCWPHDNMSFFP